MDLSTLNNFLMKQFKRDCTQNSNKLHLDQYYTPIDLAKYIVEKTQAVVPYISEWIEPSAGNGVFLQFLTNYLAYDIEPKGENIQQADYLSLEIPYKRYRCVIGNPPYGSRLNLAKAFCNKSFGIADYVAFILPISQLNNTQSIYKFDLIHSEDLGKRLYSDRLIHCCFNIYKRPKNGLNKRESYKTSKIIEIREVRIKVGDISPHVSNFEYDLAISAWGGNPTTGKGVGQEVTEGEVAKTFYIKIKNGDMSIKELILNADWLKMYPMTATPNLLQWQVYKFVEENYKNS